jgi:hypothetical protein
LKALHEKLYLWENKKEVNIMKHFIRLYLALFRQESGVEEPEDDVEVGGDQLSQMQLQRQLIVQRCGS